MAQSSISNIDPEVRDATPVMDNETTQGAKPGSMPNVANAVIKGNTRAPVPTGGNSSTPTKAPAGTEGDVDEDPDSDVLMMSDPEKLLGSEDDSSTDNDAPDGRDPPADIDALPTNVDNLFGENEEEGGVPTPGETTTAANEMRDHNEPTTPPVRPPSSRWGLPDRRLFREHDREMRRLYDELLESWERTQEIQYTYQRKQYLWAVKFGF